MVSLEFVQVDLVIPLNLEHSMICAGLRDFVTFLQFKKPKKHTQRSVNFSNVVFRFQNWYQIMQHISSCPIWYWYSSLLNLKCSSIIKSTHFVTMSEYGFSQTQFFSVNFVPTRKNTGHGKPIFWHILHSKCFSLFCHSWCLKAHRQISEKTAF